MDNLAGPGEQKGREEDKKEEEGKNVFGWHVLHYANLWLICLLR
jgi:hypothetical protein